MKKSTRINIKTCFCVSAFLLFLIITLVSLSLSTTLAKYSKEFKLSPTWQVVIPNKVPAGDVNSQEPPSIEEVKPNTVYQVKSGDTLSYIAEKFNVTLEALAAYNNIENTDNIQVGAILRIPPKDYVPPVSSEPSEETVGSIAEKTENSAADKTSEPSAVLSKSETSKDEQSENGTTAVNSDGTSKTDTALTSETTENTEEMPTAESDNAENTAVSDSVSESQSGILQTSDKETE